MKRFGGLISATIFLALCVSFYVFVAVPLYVAVFPMAGVPSTSTLDMTETELTLSDGSTSTTITVQKAYIDRWVTRDDGSMYSVTLHIALPDMLPWRIVIRDHMKTHGATKKETEKTLRQRELYLTLWGRRHISFQSHRANLWSYKTRWKMVDSYNDEYDLYTDKKTLPREYWYLAPRASAADDYYLGCYYLTAGWENTLCTVHFWACPSARSYAAFPMGRLADATSIYAKVREFTERLCVAEQ